MLFSDNDGQSIVINASSAYCLIKERLRSPKIRFARYSVQTKDEVRDNLIGILLDRQTTISISATLHLEEIMNFKHIEDPIMCALVSLGEESQAYAIYSHAPYVRTF